MEMDTSEIKVSVIKSPSYLAYLLNTVDDIILIHRKNDPLNLNESYVIPALKNTKDEDNFLDITGSPLKVNLNNSSFLSVDSINTCMNLWNKNEEQHYPFSNEIAQKYIQEYVDKNYKNEKNVRTWWVLNGTNEDKTVLLSALQLPTSISTSKVNLKKYLPKNHPSITFQALCNKHFEIVAKTTGETQKIPLRQLQCQISNTYELYGSKITTVEFDDKHDIQGSVYLNITWNRCCADIPLDHSTSTLTIQTVVGQQNSALSQFWNELILLELYIKALNEYNSETMLNTDWLPCGKSSDDSSLIDKVIQSVQKCQQIPRNNYKENEENLKKIMENIGQRNNCDITDHLWMILNKCSTYGALNECLSTVFTEILRSDSSVYIADSNMTSMAQIIRDIIAGKTAVFMLTGTQPIEILIDIGLEKLRKDFSYILTQSNICSEQDLRQIFNLFTGNDQNLEKSKHICSALYHKKSLLNLDQLDTRMKILGQLQTVIETLLLVPNNWLTLSSKTIFDYYVGNSSPIESFLDLAKNKLYEIQVNLPVTKVYEYVKTVIPLMWKLSLTQSKSSFSVTNVFHFSQQPIFPPVIYVIPEMMEEGDQTYYHYTLLTSVTHFIKTNLV